MDKYIVIDGVEIDTDELVDINDVHIDRNQPKEERYNDYIRQIKNPCMYKDGKYVVTISYNENGDTFENCMKNFIKQMKQKANGGKYE